MKILFNINKSKINSKGFAIITCRLTFNKKRKVFSTGQQIIPKHWLSKQQLAKKEEPDSELINMHLSLIKNKLSQAFLFLQVKGNEFSVDEIYSQYKGEVPKTEYGVLEVYNLHCAYMKKLVGVEIKQVTYSKYIESGRHLKDFVRFKYKKSDVQLKSLKKSFTDQYEYYLKTEKKFQMSILNKAIQRFRRSIKFAISEDYLLKDPFLMYKAKSVKKRIIYLSSQELEKLRDVNFKIKRIQQIKDMFVFCCYTGLGFSKMKHLKKSNISVFGGQSWLTISRNKTKRVYKVPLLPIAKQIMDRYWGAETEEVFPSISNANFSAYLKEIADVVGIEINLTHHIARKTFATTVLLYNDVPIEVVSKLLGHSKVQTIQSHYAEVVESKLGDEMKKLSKKLK